MRDKDAQRFIKRYQTSPPVDVDMIAAVLGLQVEESEDMPEGIAGKIVRDKASQSEYRIVVRKADHPIRKRFTIAHEIAHYLLHRHLFAARGGLVDNALYRSEMSDRVEAEANNAAAEILMPEHLLEPFRNHLLSSDDLAKKFNVSRQAMQIRLDSLARRSSLAFS